jgi:hypothetical protein
VDSDWLGFALPVAEVEVPEPWLELAPELDEFASDPVLEPELELLPLDFDPEPFIPRVACHQFSVDDPPVLPELGVLDVVPAGVTEDGLVLAAVFEALVVLAEPPLTLGWTLIAGCTSIAGCTFTIVEATAMLVSRL